MNHRHAHVHGLFGIGCVIGFSVEEDLPAGIFCINAHQNFHQGGFSGAIFSHQCMDFTGPYLQLHMIQRDNTRKRFADIFHFQHIFHAIPPLFYDLVLFYRIHRDCETFVFHMTGDNFWILQVGSLWDISFTTQCFPAQARMASLTDPGFLAAFPSEKQKNS